MAPTDSLKAAARQVRRRDERQRAHRVQHRPVRHLQADPDRRRSHDHRGPRRLGSGQPLNRLGETGAWSVEALRLEFEELTLLGSDLLDTGFEMAEIDTPLLEDDDEGDGSEVATSSLPGAFTTSRLGDVWSLGQHRLICGDAREAAIYDRLLYGSELATLVRTDEPFNVANVGHVTGNPGHREFAVAHGEMSREEFASFNCA
jgi:hypothetical protein